MRQLIAYVNALLLTIVAQQIELAILRREVRRMREAFGEMHTVTVNDDDCG